MTRKKSVTMRRALRSLVGAGLLAAFLVSGAAAQPAQRVEVTIKNYQFITKQIPLQPYSSILITIRNDDNVRHDFGSTIFEGTVTQIESEGITSYGRGIAGVFIDPGRGAAIRFTVERPGKYEFRCSIHADMKGELLLMNVGIV